MKHIILFIFLCCFTLSCTTTIERRTGVSSRDAFREESFLRYSDDRLARIEGLSYKGLRLCYRGQSKKGLELLRAQGLRNENRPDHWNRVGLCHFIVKDYIKASFYFDLALKKSKKKLYVPALNNIGILHLYHNRYQEAFDHFLKAHKSAQHLRVPRFNLAQIYLRFHILDPAYKILSGLYRQNPEDAEVVYSLASVHLLKNQLKKAQDLLNLIPKEQKSREDIALVRSLLYYQQKEYSQALKAIKGQKFTMTSLEKSAQKLITLCKDRLRESEQRKQFKLTKD